MNAPLHFFGVACVVTHTWLHSRSLEEISECSLIIVLVLQSVANVVPEFGIVRVHLEEVEFGLQQIMEDIKHMIIMR